MCWVSATVYAFFYLILAVVKQRFSVLKMRPLRLGEVKEILPGHTGGRQAVLKIGSM